MAPSIEPRESQEAAFSVSQAMSLAQHALESVTVRIIGEVSEVSVKPGYKAAYFTIKDTGASLPCMMWNNRYRASGVELAIGQLIEVTGRFTLYAVKGRMNFDVFSIELSGEGQLRLRVANIAKKLAAEGLVDAARKRSIPQLVDRIGLVTSPRSAAVHDVLRTLRRRYPLAKVLLAGVPVEGAQAASGIEEGIRCVVAAGAEVVLVVRGGGSFEDLMPFNDESLARTIAACEVPVVTGIGHEVDTTIADMVSDFRASTPTAAAEAVSPSPERMAEYFKSSQSRMGRCVERRLERTNSHLDGLAQKKVFEDPMSLFSADAMALDMASERLAHALPRRIEREHALLKTGAIKLEAIGVMLTSRFENQFLVYASRLDDLSPISVLARGYAIARDSSGAILKDASVLSIGESVNVKVSQGSFVCEVQEIE